MKSKGCEEDTVREQIVRLSFFGFAKEERFQEWVTEPLEDGQVLAQGSEEEMDEWCVAGGELPPATPSVCADAEGPHEGLQRTEPGLEPDSETGYVVAATRYRGYRTLHFVGKCFRVPGLRYFEFETYGAERPPPEVYHKVCKNCWPVKMSGDKSESSMASSSSASLSEETQ